MRTEKDKKNYRNWYNRNKAKARTRKAELMRKYRAENPEKHRMQSRASKKKLNDALFEMYGKICECGFDDMRALTLDHVLNNGAEERKSLGERGVYRRAIEKYRPKEYRTLCMNCQFIKRVEAKRKNQSG